MGDFRRRDKIQHYSMLTLPVAVSYQVFMGFYGFSSTPHAAGGPMGKKMLRFIRGDIWSEGAASGFSLSREGGKGSHLPNVGAPFAKLFQDAYCSDSQGWTGRLRLLRSQHHI